MKRGDNHLQWSGLRLPDSRYLGQFGTSSQQDLCGQVVDAQGSQSMAKYGFELSLDHCWLGHSNSSTSSFQNKVCIMVVNGMHMVQRFI